MFLLEILVFLHVSIVFVANLGFLACFICFSTQILVFLHVLYILLMESLFSYRYSKIGDGNTFCPNTSHLPGRAQGSGWKS